MPKYTEFYFEPRRGVVKDTPIISQYYVYRLSSNDREYVESMLKQAVARSEGLCYPVGFHDWLKEHDMHWDQGGLW